MRSDDKVVVAVFVCMFGALAAMVTAESCSSAARYEDCVKYHAPEKCK